MKVAPKNILIGSIVVGIIIIVAAWYFIYSDDVKEAENIANSNKTLQARIDELNAKNANRQMYLEGIENAQKIIDCVLEKYGPGNTSEKTIMHLIDAEQKNNIFISSASFSDDSPIYISSELDEDGQPKIQMFRSSLSYNLTEVSYNGFKRYVDYINSYPERMTLEGFSLSYDSGSGKISTGISINMYSVKDENHIYKAPEFDELLLGNPNIFRTIEKEIPEGEVITEGAVN